LAEHGGPSEVLDCPRPMLRVRGNISPRSSITVLRDLEVGRLRPKLERTVVMNRRGPKRSIFAQSVQPKPTRDRAEVPSGIVDEEVTSRTGRLVLALQDQVGSLTDAVRSLQRSLPAPLVSVQDAAARLGVSVNTVRRRVKSGDIPSTRIGKVVRVDLTNLRPLSDDEIRVMAQRALQRRTPAID